MLIFPLFNLLSVTLSDENGPEMMTDKEAFPISRPDDLDAYCRHLTAVRLTSHRPNMRQSRGVDSQFRDFTAKDLDEFTDDHWRTLLGDKSHLRCTASEFVPRRRDQLKDFPEMTCHNLCRACFKQSLPVCLRRNPDNDFGITCYCSYATSAPVVNHTFKIFD